MYAYNGLINVIYLLHIIYNRLNKIMPCDIILVYDSIAMLLWTKKFVFFTFKYNFKIKETRWKKTKN